MSLSGSLRISTSGMHAERFRMDVISGNIANANTVNGPGLPEVRRQNVVLSGGKDGVNVLNLEPDNVTPMRREYEPGHPYSDAEGFVTYSNINPVFEMVDMISASRAYEANQAAFNSGRQMLNAALSIGRNS